MAINVGDKGFKDGLLTKANLQTLGSDIMLLATKDIQGWIQGLDRGHDCCNSLLYKGSKDNDELELEVTG